MVKIKSHSNIIGGLLLSTLVWTLPLNFELETLAQVETVQTTEITKQEDNKQNHQKLLQTTNKLQQEAANFRQAIDQLNADLEKRFNSTRNINKINLKPVLVRQKEFNKTWQEFNKQSEITKFTQTKEISKTLSTIEELLSSLETSLKNSSEAKTLNQFALASTREVRDVELQIAQIQIQLLSLEQNVDTNPKSNSFFSLKILLLLTLLSGCTLLVILKVHNQNYSLKKIKTKNQDRQINKKSYPNASKSSQQSYGQHELFGSSNNWRSRTSRHPNQRFPTTNHGGDTDYTSPLSKKKNHQRTNNNQTSKTKTFSNHPISKNSRSQSNSLEYYSTNIVNKTNKKQALPKSVSPVTYVPSNLENPNISDREILEIYDKNPRELSKKSIKVAAARESIEQRRAGIKTPILFTETTSDSYWIILEPKDNNRFFLVPKPNLVINSLIYQTIKDIFNCQGYHDRTSNKFQLKEFAVVQSEESGCWKLIKPGELIFS